LSIRLENVIITTEVFLNRIKDTYVIALIEQIGEHYRTNISNRFLRPVLLQLQIDKSTWDQVEILTEKMEMFRYQGFHLDELYRQIASCARLVQAARHEMVPTLRSKLSSGPDGPDKVLRDMAANNFMSNLQVFANRLNELYKALVEMDRAESKGKLPVYTQIPELFDISRQLFD
jgi:hypothetical protein